MQKKISNAFLLLSVCIALNGCGTKGPLYIPEQQYPQEKTIPTTPDQTIPVEAPPTKSQ